MIYLVTAQQDLFGLEDVKNISVEESLNLANSWGKYLQIDSETSGRDPHLCDLLCFQIGNLEGTDQIVIDCNSYSIVLYKELLESHFLVGHNLKFDLQFLYKYNIVPRKVYDTMIVEQLLHLGWPSSEIRYSLKDVAWRRLNKDIDKSVRGEIIWRGLDYDVIKYAAGDVMFLGDIMKDQLKDCKEHGCIKAAEIECKFVPAIAYLEWCGIHLNQDKWRTKMVKDQENLVKAEEELNKFIISRDDLKEFTYVNLQGDLFTGFNTSPICTIKWSSSQQVVKLAKKLGFNVTTQDKKTGEDKESVMEKQLASQKGVCDKFLKLYFAYQEYFKVCTSFGQGHLDAINPITGRIHTIYKQLGAASGRMSCGSQQSNIDLAKYKGLPPKCCTYPNIQQLPKGEDTRGSFTSEEGNLWVSCDYSAQEGRVQGDIYQDEAILKMYREGIDGHSMYAKIFFKDELKDIDVSD